MSALIVIEPDKKLATLLGDSINKQHGLAWQSAPDVAAAAAVDEADIRLIVIGPGVPEADALDFAQSVSKQRPDISTVLVRREVDKTLLRQALRVGLADVVAASDGQLDELETAVEVALRRAVHLRSDEDAADHAHRGAMVTVLSTKGGVGKSVVASNLAVLLASWGHKTVLVDLALRSGDMGIMLQLKPDRTIADAAADSDHLDSEMLQGFLTEHVSGAKVLLAPAQPDDADVVSAPRLSRILDLLGESFDYIVIDTPPTLDDSVLTALDKSDTIYMIATMDVASVKDTRLTLQRLGTLGYSAGVVKLLLNRADSSVWLAPADVERAVGLEISGRIPSDRLVPRSVNKGVPVVTEAPKSAVAKSLGVIAKSIVARGGAS